MKKHIKSILRLLIVIIFVFIFISITNLKFVGYLQRSVSTLINNVEKKRILTNIKDYDTLETRHFIIRFDGENDKIAYLTGEVAEKYYNAVCDMFNYYPEEKSIIIIYNDGDELLKNTRLNKQTYPMGVYYSGVINILSPSLWINDVEDFNIIYEKEGPIVHEFTHLIVDKIAHGNYPMWLTEGIALYTEYKLTGFEWGKDIEHVDGIDIKSLDKNFSELDQYIAYRKSFEVIKKISDVWGFEKLKDILVTLGEGNNLKSSTKAVLKTNLYEIE
ncbi:peptidase MA family metallohydrolase [Caloranaerobacter azorensis]|uniref:peptidase MA family metallohydrolase n=1 Tax=Caloranaerobacter azorensis TaxID=116090 RepID=UPI00068F30D5|nr:peptidase MA family metallohydrolase [Caloranaerobacter azorensis]